LSGLLCCSLVGIGISTARADVTTIEIMYYFNVKDQLDALNALKSEFEQAHPDIKVQYTYIPFPELVSRTLQTAAVHRPPAISCIDNPDVRHVAKSNILQDISGKLSDFPLWKDTYPGPKNSVTEGDKVYGIPIGSNSLALFYNKKMFADAGIAEPPKTWAELVDDAVKLTKSPVYGLAFSATNDEQSTWQWEPFLWSNGGSLLDLSSDKAKEALQLWVDLVQKGAVSKDALNWQQGDVANQFIGGRAAMMVMGPWMLASVKRSGIDYGVVTIPVPKEGMKPVVPLGGEVWCPLKTDKKVEDAALEFIKFTQEPARLTKICNTFNYISSVRSIAQQQGQEQPDFLPFVKQMDTARSRPEEGGAQYTAVSLAARTAIQKALSGQATVAAALEEAAAKIKTLPIKK
jgi:multiple sugar transport system substrate-binding protein